MIEAALVTLLSDDAAVTALIGTRVHPDTDPQESPRPKATWRRVSTRRPTSNDGPLGVPTARFYVDCWADTLAAAYRVSRAVREAVDGYTGTVATSAGDVVIDGIRVADERDNPAPIPAGQNKGPQRVTLELFINYQE